MYKKFNFLIAFIALSACLGLMSTTYSRYVSDTTGNIEVLFAKWQILVNNIDITNESDSSIIFEPVMEENEHVAPNVIAPSSKGYFDIDIDPTNVDVSFKYKISLEIENEDMPDLIISKYAFIPEEYVEGDPLEMIDLEENGLENSMIYDKTIEGFRFEPMKIRVYFEWYEGENEMMDDNADTAAGKEAAENELKLQIKASISFEQIFE